MVKLSLVFLLFCVSCGDENERQSDDDTASASDTSEGTDDSDTNTDDSDSQTIGDSGGTDGDDSGTNVDGGDFDTTGDSGVTQDTDTDSDTISEIDALAACTDFQVASWDRIRACGSPTAAILPENAAAGSVCAMLCQTEGQTVPKSAYDTCVTYAKTIDCADIDIDLDAGSQIPEECAFLRDQLDCLF